MITTMKDILDCINIELKVIAVQMDLNIWMQGDIEIIINGEKPYAESDIVNCETLFESLEKDGEYFIFSCNCGLPKCSGWINGIMVTNREEKIEWININTKKIWNFDRVKIEDDIKTIKEEVKVYKQFFKQKEIDYVGVGYSW